MQLSKAKVITSLAIILLLLFFSTGCNGDPQNSEEGKAEDPIGDEFVEPIILETDYAAYFTDVEGSAVFYTPSQNEYKIYNREAAMTQYSPCSTFKIISLLAALENGVITQENSLRNWSGETYWNEKWNCDMEFDDAFKTSCVWYFRGLTDEMGEVPVKSILNQLQYGNQDISDWSGLQNKNNNNRSLTGFWVESSLKISPKEQTEVLDRIFGESSPYDKHNLELLKEVMAIEQNQTNIAIYGKTGYGRLDNISLDSWFVGMYEDNSNVTYFSIHLNATDNPRVSSALAKEIAIQIIADNVPTTTN